MEDLADHDRLALDLQQMERVSEARTGDIVGVNTGAGGSPADSTTMQWLQNMPDR